MFRRYSNWILLILFAGGIYLWQRTAFPFCTVDTFPNQLGAYFWKTGQPERMYTTEAHFDDWHSSSWQVARRLGLECGLSRFMYPPFVAAVLSPVAEVPDVYWRWTLFVINAVLLLVISLQILWLCEVPVEWRPFLWALILLLWFYPMARATMLGQIVPLIAAASWAVLLRFRKGRDLGPAVTLGIVGAVKLFPLVLLVIPLLGRRWKFLLIALGTCLGIYAISLLSLGLEVHRYWWEVMREFGRDVTPFFGNQSLMASVARVFFGYETIGAKYVVDPGIAPFRFVLPLLFGGITIWILWRLRNRITTESLALAAGLAMSAVILSVPTAWEHYLLFVLPSAAWAIYDTWRNHDAKFWELWLAAAIFLFAMKLTRFSYETTLLSRTIAGSHSMGLLMLWIWFIRRAFRKPATVNAKQTAGAHETLA